MLARLLSTIAVVPLLLAPPSLAAAGQKHESPIPRSIQRELIRLRADIDAQGEARTRQADAFNAATTRIEVVNGALVVVLAVAGILTGFFGIRWVRKYAEEQVSKQVAIGIAKSGEDVFDAEAKALRDEYEIKFADLYRRYKDLVEQANDD